MENPFIDGWIEEDIEKAIRRNNPEELLHVPVCVSMNPPDCAWAEGICIKLSSHGHFNVRGNAVLGFGHLARVCGSLTLEAVKPILVSALEDESEYVRGQAIAAVDDIEHFMSYKITSNA